MTWCSDGTSTFTAKVDWGSPPPAGETYEVDVPAGTQVKTIDGGEAYEASPAAAGRTAGFDPLVSDLAPDGYELKAVATLSDGYRPAEWLGIPDLPPAMAPQPVVTQLYTRGLSWFTMEQSGPKTAKAYGSALEDWLSSSSRDRLSYQQTTLQYGALKGATASTWYQADGPSLFVAGRRRGVFVTGALTRQELIAFAEGLKQVPAAQ